MLSAGEIHGLETLAGGDWSWDAALDGGHRRATADRGDAGESACQGDQSARTHDDAVPGLPYQVELEADSLHARVQARKHWVSVAWYAREGRVHEVPHQSELQERKQELRGLPRGYSPWQIWRQLRTMSYGKRLASVDQRDPESR